MGATSSNEFSSHEIQEFRKQYTLVRSSYDYRFGQVSLYQHNVNRQLVLVNTRSFSNNQERLAFIDRLKRNQSAQHPSVARIIGYSSEVGQNICGLTSQVTIYTEFYEDDLLRELRARQKTQERYTEQEVWYLLETLVAALSFQQESRQAHGDVSPQNVILSQTGQAKILKNGIVSQYENNFVRRLQGQTNLYLAPEALESINSRFLNPQYNQFKADTYALGLTLIYVCLLQDPALIYDFVSNKVHHDQVDNLLNQVLQNYSYQLTDLLRQMLMQDPAKRPSPVELRSLMGQRPAFNAPRGPRQDPYQPLQQSLARSQLPPGLSNSFVGRRF